MTTLYDLANNFFVRATMEMLLNSIWQGIALAGLAFAFLRLMPRANAATRYGVWFATLLLLVAIPVAGVLLPYAGSKDMHTGAASRRTAAPSSPASSSPKASYGVSVAGSRAQAADDFADGSQATQNLDLSEPFAPAQLRSSRNVELPTGAWLSIFFCAWLLVACVRTGRVLASHRRLCELKRDSPPLGARHQSRLRQFLSSYTRARPVRLAGSTEINMPMAVGLRNPVIIFPLALVGQLTEDEFDQILLHELAHVQRRDDWTNFAQKLVEAILFFHPAALWIGRRLTLEREVACDDHVICVTKAGRQYAVCLTKLAELTVMPQQGSGLAPGVLQSRKHIFSRVEFLLKKGRDTNPRVSKAGLLLTLTPLVAAFLPCLLMSPFIALAAARVADENTRTQTSA
ncbi:MAG TPA: M56 family metallopeptidase, partial [Pyrinomonadaceae bacterium]|nr:M56 family metallopeptidase [Pyrinomonadaceae bacterium]